MGNGLGDVVGVIADYTCHLEGLDTFDTACQRKVMQPKLAILRNHMQAGRWRDALKLAASWPDATPEIRKGWESMARPDFQRQLNRDPEALVAAGIAALKARFG